MSPFIKRAFPVFAEPAVVRYLGGQLASTLGNWTQNITLSLMLWERTHSPLIIGFLNFFLQAPMLVVPMLMGSRLRPATVKAATLKILTTSLAISAVFLGMALFNRLDAWLALALAAILGIVFAMEWPARQLLLSSSLRDRTLLTNAVAMNAMTFNIGRMVGPAVAAGLFANIGGWAGFACSIFGLMVMLHAIWKLPRIKQVETTNHERPSMRAALKFALQDEFARRYLPLLICMGFFVGSYQTVIPVLSASVFGSVSRYTGSFFACAGAGAFSAAIALSMLRNPELTKRALNISPWMSFGALIGISVSTIPVISGGFFFLIGLSISLSNTQINSILQQRSPVHLRGGMVGLYAVTFLGTMPLGHVLMGAVANQIGPRLTFMLMGVCFISVLWILRALIPRNYLDK